jgi:hypothetical protein
MEASSRHLLQSGFIGFPPYSLYRTLSVEKLDLYYYMRKDIILLQFLLFRSILALYLAFRFWRILAFVFLPAILGDACCLVLVPLTNTVLLLDAPMLPTCRVEVAIYLYCRLFFQWQNKQTNSVALSPRENYTD